MKENEALSSLSLDSFFCFRAPDFCFLRSLMCSSPHLDALLQFLQCSCSDVVYKGWSRSFTLIYLCFLPPLCPQVWLCLSKCFFGVWLLFLSKLCGCQCLPKGFVDWKKCNYLFPVVCDSCQLQFWPVHCFLKSSSPQPRLLFCSSAALMCTMWFSVISSVVFLASLWSDDALHHHISVDHDRPSYPWAKPEWSQTNGQCRSLHPLSKPRSLWAFPWEYLMRQSG